tara:strand:+ start:2405 stop:2791 length:387 start_codon:yes stop_codon:yes gene_type:complete
MSPATKKLMTIKRFSICLLIAQALDIITTYAFLSLGGTEGNPVMAAILVSDQSFFVMFLVKIAIALLICHSVDVRLLQYKIKELAQNKLSEIDLNMKEKVYGVTIIALVATYWTVIGWNFAGIYFLYT